MRLPYYSLLLLGSYIFTDASIAQTKQKTPVIKAPQSQTEQQIKNVVNEFISSVNNTSDFQIPQSYVFGAREGFYGANVFFKNWSLSNKRQIKVSKILIDRVQAENATVTILYQIQSKKVATDPNSFFTSRVLKEILNLKIHASSNGKIWKIVPPDSFPYPVDNSHELNTLVYALAQRKVTSTSEANAKASANYMHQTGLAAIQFAMDYKKFAFSSENVDDALTPYLKAPDFYLIQLRPNPMHSIVI